MGTLLGGAAVWLGLHERMESTALERAAELPEELVAAEPDPSAEPSTEAEGRESGGSESAIELAVGDPGDSPLVRAIERTRHSVVTIKLAGSAAGAGVVYDASGTLLTNYHVIAPILRASRVLGESGDALTVRFVDGRERSRSWRW
jgi:S1-C subfamily serine protease